MRKKIVINSIDERREAEDQFVEFSISVDDKTLSLWYKVEGISDKDYRKIDEGDKRIDAIVVTFLLFAMKGGYDFYSEKYPISEKLYYNLVYQVMPQIKVTNPSHVTEIKIFAPCTREIFSGKWIGTVLSCGADSMTTFLEYSELCELNDYRLTHLLYFKTGAHDGEVGRFDREVENRLFSEQLETVRNFSQKASYPLIVVDSNLNYVLSSLFGFTGYDQTHTYRSIGVMLLLQNYFCRFYYADSYSTDKFKIDVFDDSGYYEKWLVNFLSSGSLECYSANKNMTRMEKTKLLSTHECSYDSLTVCWKDGHNCGKCNKCIRTLVTLDLLGVLDRYRNCFDVDAYRDERERVLARVILNRKHDHFFDEIYQYMVEQHIAMPSKSVVFLEQLKYLCGRCKGRSLPEIIVRGTKYIFRQLIGR